MTKRMIGIFGSTECKIRFSLKIKMLAAALSVALAVTLPQLAHLAGSALGVGNSIGATLLPMHLPILLVGFLAGPMVGGVAGLLSPCISFLLSGMPVVSALPLMMVELAVYGAFCGALKGCKMPLILKLLSAQVLGRLVRAIAAMIIAGTAGAGAWSSLVDALVTGMPGLILQWLLIPVIIYVLERYNEKYEH